MKSLLVRTLLATLLVTASSVSNANFQTDSLADLGRKTFSPWINNTLLVELLKAQNSKTAGLSESEIIALDKRWREELIAIEQPFIDQVMNNALSDYLTEIKHQSNGHYAQIFVMDARGLNVGQSDITPDYWQGDEAKWQQPYRGSEGAVHVGSIQRDTATQRFLVPLSAPIADPESGDTIGVVTVVVSAEMP